MIFQSSGTLQICECCDGLWAYIQCCPGLGEYYRYWQQKMIWAYISAPKDWGPHISIVRGEDVKNLSYLYSQSGKEYVFQYEHKIITNDYHYWLPVQSEQFLDLRWELGLYRRPFVEFHLTFGVKVGYSIKAFSQQELDELLGKEHPLTIPKLNK